MIAKVIDKYMSFAGIVADEYSVGEIADGRFCIVENIHGSWEILDVRDDGVVERLNVLDTDELACYHLYGILAERHIEAGTLVQTSRQVTRSTLPRPSLMNRSTLVGHLRRAGVSADKYFVGGTPDETLCIIRGADGLAWEVFYQERGAKQGLRVFDNEEAACWHMYAFLIMSEVMSMRLVPVDAGSS